MAVVTDIPETPLPEEAEAPRKAAGILVEFADPTALVEGVSRIHKAGYTKFDAYSPFPVHGIDPAMGIKPTILPPLVLTAGLTGLAIATLFQLWANGMDYAMIISGKPLFALPANVPIMFEFTVLLSALTAFLGVIALNRLPHLYNAVFSQENFKRVSSDGFFAFIDVSDPKYHPEETKKFVESLDPKSVEVCRVPAQRPQLPRSVYIVGAVLAVAAVIPPAMIAKARATHSTQTRIQLMTDMDYQQYYKAQEASTLFDDGRAMRPPVANTVARGYLKDDEHFFFGKQEDGEFATALPIEPTEDAMKRGEERFRIYCSACHGYNARGGRSGMVSSRALDLGEGTWTPPKSLVEDEIATQPVGAVFNTITNGVKRVGSENYSMPPYGDKIPPADRWAIILYLEALQRSYNASLEDVPPEAREELNQKRPR